MSEYKLKITLKSDICSGSGYAYSGLVDSDVCFDDLGIPYIPGRRLKGCLKESADMLADNDYLEDTDCEVIFGKSGADRSGGILVGNAYIEGYEELREQLSAAIMKEKETRKEAQLITPQKILDRFTSVKAQTKIEDGIAKDDTLRYTRVVNQHCATQTNGLSGELTFSADVTLDDEYFELVKDIVSATRNIGMDRTRGLGSVVCEISRNTGASDSEISTDNGTKYEDEADVEIRISVKNTAPLMISGENDEVSLNFIPAQNVIGALAGQYLKTGDYGKEFEDLFLNGQTKFSNLYAAKAGSNDDYIPAPSFINKLKKTGKYVNLLKLEDKDDLSEDELLSKDLHPQFADENKTQSGNMPQKLKGKYIAIETKENGIISYVKDISETEMNIDYHHSKKAGAEKNESILYTNEVIKEGQIFSGSIITKGKYVNMIMELLETVRLRFGKSKSAQYGSCVLLNAEVKKYEMRTVHVTSGETIYVSLVSDGIFMNEHDYTVRYDEIRKKIAESVNLEETEENDENLFSFVSTGMTFGYNTKWNLRKQPVPVVSAGSTFVYKAKKDCNISEKFVGERVHEGFGRIRIFKEAGYDLNPEVGKSKGDDSYVESLGKDSPPPDTQTGSGLSGEIEKIEKDSQASGIVREIITDAVLLALPKAKHMSDKVDNTQLGRLTLMLKQSKNDANDFCNRVESIKNEGIRTDLYGWLCSIGLFDMKDGKLHEKNSFTFGKADEIFDIYESITDDMDFRKDFVKDHRYRILMTYITAEKYNKKIEETAASGSDKAGDKTSGEVRGNE